MFSCEAGHDVIYVFNTGMGVSADLQAPDS